MQSRTRLYSIVHTALTVLFFAIAYFILQRLTFTLRFPPIQRTTIWTPGALCFTALLLTPARQWWIYYVGVSLGSIAAFYDDGAITVERAMLMTPFHFGSVVLAVLTIRRISPKDPFNNLPSLIVFTVFAIVVIPVVTSAPGDLVRYYSGAVDIWPVALRSILSSSLGILLATPALTLTLKHGRAWIRSGTWQRYLEISCLALGLGAVGYFCFQGQTGSAALPSLLYAPLPLLLWAAVRFGLAGVCWALLALAFQSSWGAIQGLGPFTSQAPVENVLQLQLFLLAISLPLMFLAVVMHERRESHSALSDSEQEVRRQFAQLNAIYHNAPVGLAFVDNQLRYVSINDHLAELNGIPADAHLGRTIRQALPHLAASIEPHYQRVLESGQPIVNVEVQNLTQPQTGMVRSWLVSRYPVKNPQGIILGVITVVHEITERKRTEQQFRLIVESIPNAIVMINQDGNITMVNAQCELSFGYHRDELLGHPVELLVPERYRVSHPGFRNSFFGSPSIRSMGAGRELYGRRKDGSEFPIEIGLTPIQNGAGLHVLSAIVDITQRKQAEEATRELAHASRLAMVGELTASIAHEINQPLGAILSNTDAAEMILDSNPANLTEVRHILDDIRKDDLRASEVIRRLRMLLRKNEMELQPVNLNEVIIDVLGMIRTESHRRHVVMETDLTQELPMTLGNKVHLQQVLLNLLLNGMEAMSEMREVKKLVVRTHLKDHNFAVISVTDMGEGISPDHLSHLFDAFYSTKKNGMGLGLSIARSLVEKQGGRIWAENNPDGGATFRFTVPTMKQ